MSEMTEPAWTDHCRHGSHSLIGTVECGTGLIDVYTHDQDGTVHVCIRYGDDGPDYYSAGPLDRFMREASESGIDAYRKAREVLIESDSRVEQSMDGTL